MRVKKSQGIKILGWFFILTSLIQIFAYVDFEVYAQQNAPLAGGLLIARYMISICLRAVGLAVGIGLLLKIPKIRTLAIGLCLFTILTIYWKHPYHAFYNIAQKSEIQYLGPQSSAALSGELKYPHFPFINMLVHYCADLAFSGFVIYYLTRREVVRQFEENDE